MENRFAYDKVCQLHIVTGGVGTLVGPDAYAGRPLFGVSDWGWLSGVWTGTSYVFPNCGSNSGVDQDPPDNNPLISTPEPATMLFLATGLAGLLVYRRFSDVDT